MSGWGISNKAPLIEKVKSNIEDILRGLNSVGEITYSVYSEIYNETEKNINLLDDPDINKVNKYCFHVNDKKELDRLKDWNKISDNKENYHLCVARELYQDIQKAKKIGKLIFYNDKKRIFTDKNFKKIKLNKEDIIYPRINAKSMGGIIRDIYKEGAKSIINIADIIAITRWPQSVSTNRKIKIISIDEFFENKDFYLNTYANEKGKVFLKTMEKGISGVFGEREIGMKFLHVFEGHHLNRELIISNIMNIKKDRYGKKEHRCFVIQNKVRNISRYMDYESIEIPKKVEQKAERIVEENKCCMPNNYVVDLAETDIGVEIVEFNPIIGSGRYIDNDFVLDDNMKKIEIDFSKEDEEKLNKLLDKRNNLNDNISNMIAKLKKAKMQTTGVDKTPEIT